MGRRRGLALGLGQPTPQGLARLARELDLLATSGAVPAAARANLREARTVADHLAQALVDLGKEPGPGAVGRHVALVEADALALTRERRPADAGGENLRRSLERLRAEALRGGPRAVEIIIGTHRLILAARLAELSRAMDES